MFDTGSVNLAAVANPFAGVTFHATNADVELVMVHGAIRKRDGRLTGHAWPVVAKELKRRADEIRERMPQEKLHELWEEYYKRFGSPVFG